MDSFWFSCASYVCAVVGVWQMGPSELARYSQEHVIHHDKHPNSHYFSTSLLPSEATLESLAGGHRSTLHPFNPERSLELITFSRKLQVRNYHKLLSYLLLTNGHISESPSTSYAPRPSLRKGRSEPLRFPREKAAHGDVRRAQSGRCGHLPATCVQVKPSFPRKPFKPGPDGRSRRMTWS